LRKELLDGRYPNAAKLARVFEITTRTAQRDIEYLRDQLGWDIEYDSSHKGYVARGPLAMAEAVLAEGDIVAVLVAMPLVAMYRGTAYGERLRRVFERLCANLPDGVDVRMSELDEAMSVRGTSVPIVDPDVLEALQDAARDHETLLVTYVTMSRERERTSREIDPYHLSCIDGQWYTIAFCHERCDVRVFAAWRIERVAKTKKYFTKPVDFRADEFLSRTFRVFRGGGEQKVVVRLSGLSAELMRERDAPAEISRREMRDGRLEVELDVLGLDEVLWWVLGFGTECQVVKPKKLRKMVLEHARKVLERDGGKN